MKLFQRVTIAIFLQGFIQHQSFADLGDNSSKGSNKNIHTEIEHHPAGPVIRRIWTDPVNNLPYKIEIHSLRSGGSLLNGVKLFKENVTGNWYLESVDSKTQLLMKSQSKNTNKLGLLSEGCNWEIKVISEHLPKPAIGVATEDESNLDVSIIKKICR